MVKRADFLNLRIVSALYACIGTVSAFSVRINDREHIAVMRDVASILDKVERLGREYPLV